MRIDVKLLGGFEVLLDGIPVPSTAWSRRQAASLVKLLRPRRRDCREQIDRVVAGPPLTPRARLHKATHYARQGLGAAAVGTRAEVLWLGDDANVDVDRFYGLAERALENGTLEVIDAALAAHRGPLLPDDPYEPWAEQARERVRTLHLDLLRRAERWDGVLQQEPADEQAHLALMRASATSGDVRGAVRQYERMEQALQRELGIVPSAEAQQLVTAQCCDGPTVARRTRRSSTVESIGTGPRPPDQAIAAPEPAWDPPGAGWPCWIDGKRWRPAPTALLGQGSGSRRSGVGGRQRPTTSAYRTGRISQPDRDSACVSGRDVTGSSEASTADVVAAAELVRLAAAGVERRCEPRMQPTIARRDLQYLRPRDK